LAITSPAGAGHDNPLHPECNTRLLAALAGVPPGTRFHIAMPASEDTVHRIHTPYYTAWLRQRCAAAAVTGYLDPDTYVTRHSYDAALCAAGAAIHAAECSLDGEHAFALVRPPGHHAEHDRARGFCLLNNAAIAAAYALPRAGRVAIIDWDVHHGNGSEQAFYGTDRVLFCSVHQRHIFPGSGRISDYGIGDGTGYTINAPLEAGSGIADYFAVFTRVFVPALERFRPGAVIVSAGQDCLHDDPLGGMALRPEDFAVLTRLIADAADRPLALVLEGGYGPSHGEAIACIFSALRSGRVPEPGEGLPRESTRSLIDGLAGRLDLIR
jgi:acetoin utilization deacetylase AcuC-like enzyme